MNLVYFSLSFSVANLNININYFIYFFKMEFKIKTFYESCDLKKKSLSKILTILLLDFKSKKNVTIKIF